MLLPRRVLFFLAFSWALVVLYPDPTVLLTSVRNLAALRADPVAAQALAATLPDEPRAIERQVLDEVVPYASDWETAGVPWSFPSAAQALHARRGDCESRALVLASVLAAKGIPHQLRMSLDHLWVEYPGKVPTASESDARALAGRDGDGWSGLRWPDDLDLRRELRTQLAIYWDPMPLGRRALLLVGIGWVALWNGLVTTLTLPAGSRGSRATAQKRRCWPKPSEPSTAGGSS
jgi:transglutaminase-like putative cysteine protease